LPGRGVKQARRRWRRVALAAFHPGRLVLLFLLLALATTRVFLFGMQRMLQGGWQGYAGRWWPTTWTAWPPRSAARPSWQRAQALTQRLPITLRIEGPQVQYDSHPNGRRARGTTANTRRRAGWGLVRTTADGHRVSFGLAAAPDARRPRIFGWITLAVLLLLTAAAYARCGACCAAAAHRRRRGAPSAGATSRNPSPSSARTNWARWPSASTAWPPA
jgi:hypothetical protein